MARGSNGKRARRRNGESPLRWWGPALLPLLLVGIPILWIARDASEASAAGGYGWTDPSAAELRVEQQWADIRWDSELERVLEAHGTVALEDGEAILELERALVALPFVAEAGASRVTWPGQLTIDLRLRRPVACVYAGDGFLAVDEEGVLLTGMHEVPPRIDGGHLPVIGPVDDRFGSVREGEVLERSADLDALAVASSFWEDASELLRERIGRVTIDARGAREVAVELPGVVLDLERSRRVAFGRTPRDEAPGELAEAIKWGHLERALDPDWVEENGAWRSLDVRFDELDVLTITEAGEGANAQGGPR